VPDVSGRGALVARGPRGGFDDRAFYELFATDRADWATPVEPLPLPGAAAPFDAWLAAADRTAY
jgi:guanine deaminase